MQIREKMARITQVDTCMVDLVPKVRRPDAVQSLVSPQTPLVTINHGVRDTGQTCTIGTAGPAVISLLRETLVPQLIGRKAAKIERIWRDLLVSTRATAEGAITALALAAIDTALWDLRCKRAGLPGPRSRSASRNWRRMRPALPPPQPCRLRLAKAGMRPASPPDDRRASACSIVRVDVARVGGIAPGLTVAHRAEVTNIPVWPHFWMDLPVSLVCAILNSRMLE